MYRHKNGKFQSKRSYLQELADKKLAAKLRLSMTLILMFFFTSLGYFTQSDVLHYQRTAQAFESQTDLCQLEVVVCDDEQPVEEAAAAIGAALNKQVTEETRKRLQYLYDKATAAGVPFKDAVKTIYCESRWYSVKSALPEESYGLSQIHLPSHRGVAKEQALDAYFAIDFLVERWNDTKWYAYDRATGQCANDLTIKL
jgi:hypothetical protein